MAQFYDNFTAYGTGSWTTNTNWQRRIIAATATTSFPTDVDGINGRVLRIAASSADGSRVLSYNPAGSTINADILVRFESSIANATTGGRIGIAYVRYAGTTEATTVGYCMYSGTFASARRIGIVEDSTGVTLASAAFSMSASTWYWARLQASGTTVRGKVWTGAVTSEPASWTISGTNSTKSTAGYHGVGTFKVGTVNYGWFGIGTNGDVPLEPHVLASKTISGNVRITATTDQNINGNVRISNTATKDITGNIRIGVIRTKTQVGTVRIQKSVTKNQVGTVRIQKSATKTIAGNIRIQKAVTKSQTGQFWIGAPPTVQDQIGNVTITKNVAKNIVGRVRIQRERLKDQLGDVRIQRSRDKTQSGDVSILATTDRSQVGIVNIERLMRKTILGRVRIQRTVTKDISGNFRIEKVITRNIQGNIRIQKSATRNQSGNVRIQRTRTYNIVGNIRIQKTLTKNQVGNVRIQRTVTKPQVGNVAIIQEAFHPQVGNVRIYDANTLPAAYVEDGNYLPNKNYVQGPYEGDTIEGGNYAPRGVATGEFSAAGIDEEGNYKV